MIPADGRVYILLTLVTHPEGLSEAKWLEGSRLITTNRAWIEIELLSPHIAIAKSMPDGSL